MNNNNLKDYFKDRGGDQREANVLTLTSFSKKQSEACCFFGEKMPKKRQDESYMFVWQSWIVERISILEGYLDNLKKGKEILDKLIAEQNAKK